jgi:hypothetical protein
MLLIVGTDAPLLEGLAQLLAGPRDRIEVVNTLVEAEEVARQQRPLLIVIERACLAADDGARAFALPLAPGGAFVMYRSGADDSPPPALAHGAARHVLADLMLPLERARLFALAQYVRARARVSGRGWSSAPLSP